MNLEDVQTTFVHYGHDKFDITLFNPPTNQLPYKPRGGLWGCWDDSWKEWLEDNYIDTEDDFVSIRYHSLNKKFYFKLKSRSNVFLIQSTEDFKYMINTYSENISPITNPTIRDRIIRPDAVNFAKMAKDCDAIVYMKGIELSLDAQMYGWDISSICVLNPSVIVEASERDFYNDKYISRW